MSEMDMVTILMIIVIINSIDSGIVGRVLVCLKMRADIFKMITVAIVSIIMIRVGVFVRLITKMIILVITSLSSTPF